MIKDFIREEAGGIIHYFHKDIYTAGSRVSGMLAGIKTRGGAGRIIGIDPSIEMAGFTVLTLEDWKTEKVQLDYFSACKGVGDDDIEKIRFLGKAHQQILNIMKPNMMAIEIPIVGHGFRSKNPVVQGRLFQHLIDVHPPIYYQGFSEIHNTQVKAAVLQKGDPRKKPFVVQRVCEEFELDWPDTKDKYVEAVCDAIAIAKAFIQLTNRSNAPR